MTSPIASWASIRLVANVGSSLSRHPKFLKSAPPPASISFKPRTKSHGILIHSHNLIGTMSWRNQGITGSNNIPLGKRRFGGDEEDGVANGGTTPNGLSNDDVDVKRGRSPEREFERHHAVVLIIY